MSKAQLFALSLLALVCITGVTTNEHAQTSGMNGPLAIPRTWDDGAMATLELPLASMGAPPKHIPSDYYYRMPVRSIYKSYPIYAPGKEPRGYFEKMSG